MLGAIRGASQVSGVYWGLAGSVGTQGPEGYRWHKGELWAPRGCRGVGGHKRGIRGVRGVLGDWQGV